MLKRAMGMTCINVGGIVKVITDNLRNKYKTFPSGQLFKNNQNFHKNLDFILYIVYNIHMYIKTTL